MTHGGGWGWLAGEVAALGALVSAFLQILPDLAAGFAAIWYLAMLYDWSQQKRAERQKAVIAAAAKAAQKVVEAIKEPPKDPKEEPK